MGDHATQDGGAERFWHQLINASLVMAIIAFAAGLPYLFSNDMTVSRNELALFAAVIICYSVLMRLVLQRAVQRDMRRRRLVFFISGLLLAPIYLVGVARDGGLDSPMALTLLPAAAMATAAFPWHDARWHLLPMAVGYWILAMTTEGIEWWRTVWGFGIGLAVVVPVTMIRRGALQYTSDQEASSALLRAEVTLDGLTGCLNHRAFHRALAEHHVGIRDSDRTCIAVLDVDNFKVINDTHGHLRGDDVLRDIGTLLRQVVRQRDIVGRIGGEEFAVLLPDAGLDDARIMAERLREAVIRTRPGALDVTVSIGIAEHDPTTALTATVNAADRALYQAKAEGRNRVAG